MTKYSGPKDIYKELVDDSDENWLYGLVAFAIIEEQKIEWIKHQEENGSPPNAGAVQSWYEQLPSSVLLNAKGQAENSLKAFMNDVAENVLDEFEEEIRESIILEEIKEIKAFMPQFVISLAGGFVGTLIFGGLLAIIAYFAINDTSPVQIIDKIHNNGMEQENGY